jgi:hypothetical protein
LLSTGQGFAFNRSRLCFQQVKALLSIVNSLCLTFLKAGCLGYLYLTVDVYNIHFCHLKFYPQNRLFQNITNERKSILFIIHKAHSRLPIHMSQMR